MRVDEIALGVWGVEVHELGGIRAARLIDILERNVANWRRNVKPAWALLDIADSSEKACALVKELKERRRLQTADHRPQTEEPAAGAAAGTGPGDSVGMG